MYRYDKLKKYVDKEILQDLWENLELSVKEISEELHMSQHAVRYYLIKYEIINPTQSKKLTFEHNLYKYKHLDNLLFHEKH